MFSRQVRPRNLVELTSIVVVVVGFEDSMLCPPLDCLFVNSEALCHFLSVQHSSAAKPILARAEPVGMHEISDSLGGKALISSPRSR